MLNLHDTAYLISGYNLKLTLPKVNFGPNKVGKYLCNVKMKRM